MLVRGIIFAGTATTARPQMREFVRDVLGMTPTHVQGVEADLFDLPDGSSFAVASPGGMGDTGMSLGFLVDNVEEAISQMTAAGVVFHAAVSSNERERYVHFTAPDGQLYELVERL